MAYVPGHTPTHKGKSTTTDAIHDPRKVLEVKELLKDNVRDLALWTLSLNSALRAGDLCNLTWDDVHDDGQAIKLILLEGKTAKRRVIPLNKEVSTVLRAWRAKCEHQHIYSGQRGRMTTATWGRMVKGWCSEVGLKGRFATHSARKTFCRLQYEQHGVKLATLMHILNHSSELQTLTYLGCLSDEISRAYSNTI